MVNKKISVLIVDDNIHFALRMASLLDDIETVGTIHLAHNYDEATSLLTSEPDIVLLDIHLPGKNGITLLKKIKGSAQKCEVIMISNYTGEYYRQQCKELGARLFFDKTTEFECVPDFIKTFNN